MTLADRSTSTTPRGLAVRPDIHPAYAPVVYQDRSTGDMFLTRSTATSSETVEWSDGNTYPLIRVDITAYSHPFWTGAARVLDSAGAVEKFRRRYGDRSRG
nr:type B 50S ribosomal protein L31 [Pseudonocardia acidicola]